MPLFSERLALLSSENAFKIGPHIREIEGRGRSVVKLNLGEPDFPTPAYIKDEIKRQVDLNNTRYADPQGILSLREAIAGQVEKTRGVGVEPGRVVVFPGVKPTIGLVQQVYLNPGDEVIYPAPGFPIYESFIRYVGGIPVPLILKEEDRFSFRGEDLARLVSPKTKLIILNFPSNPTGAAATKAELGEIARVIRKYCPPEVRIYSDEIYEQIIFDGRGHHSLLSEEGMASCTILASGHSKAYAWPGGRVGYAVFPTRKEAEVFTTLNINYFSCVSPYNQEAARLALEDGRGRGEIGKMVEEFQRRKDFVLSRLREIPGITCLSPEGAFYVFPNIEGICRNLGVFDLYEGLEEGIRRRTSAATIFQMFLLYEHRVASLDRRSFCFAGAEDQHYLRFSFAASREELAQGMDRLAEAARDKAGIERFVAGGENLFS